MGTRMGEVSIFYKCRGYRGFSAQDVSLNAEMLAFLQLQPQMNTLNLLLT
jgi:hypothetical protein